MTTIEFILNVVSNLMGEIIMAILAGVFAVAAYRYKNMLNAVSKGKQTHSPDGEQTAHESGGEIYVSGHGKVVNITHSSADDSGPVWSPDSKWVAFQSNRNGGDWNIWVADVGTGKITQITKIAGRERILRWDDGCNLWIDLGGSTLVVKKMELLARLG